MSQLKVHHLSEMTQWQLDCGHSVSSVNTNAGTAQHCFCWTCRWNAGLCFAGISWVHASCRQFDVFPHCQSVRATSSLCAPCLPCEHLRILPLCSPCLFTFHSTPGYLLRWYRPIHPWRGVALPAALLQLRLHLPGEGGLETAKTSRLSWHSAEEVGNKEKEISVLV